MNKKLKLVIIGNGMAGTAALEEILKADPERYEITVIGAERHPNYNRVLLAEVLTGEKTVADIALHERGWYEDNNIKLVTGVRVTDINRAGRTLSLDDGTSEGYDRLVFSTGSVPIIPDIPGADGPRVVSFRDVDDCDRIKALLGADPKGRRAVVIGGGLLGLEAAHALVGLGADVTVIHLADRLMERQLDPTAAALLKDDIEAHGIRVLLRAETTAIEHTDASAMLRLAGGDAIEADFVVMSVGIRPNIALAMESGIYCERGIVVSDTMQTFDPAVYAVGECVQHRGLTFGLVAPLFEQARVLGDHLAGHSRLTFSSRPLQTRLKIPGIELFSAGVVDADAGGDGFETMEYLDYGEKLYKKVVVRDGRVVGVLLYGDTTDGPGLFLNLTEGTDISARRRTLLMGAALAPGENPVDGRGPCAGRPVAGRRPAGRRDSLRLQWRDQGYDSRCDHRQGALYQRGGQARDRGYGLMRRLRWHGRPHTRINARACFSGHARRRQPLRLHRLC
jgi:nitrite reductase (NADH) large subunit